MAMGGKSTLLRRFGPLTESPPQSWQPASVEVVIVAMNFPFGRVSSLVVDGGHYKHQAIAGVRISALPGGNSEAGSSAFGTFL